ncbi:MAG: M20 family metallopeptidase [Bacteroidia bacterium]|nr:M20 family metallopeptidase [Bacteroidia bacterium]
MSSLPDRIRTLAEAVFPAAVATRRDLHRHPELAFEEVRTAAQVAARLAALGIAHTTGVAKTGVVGFIEGTGGPGPTLALRADMDALPILEQATHDYASLHPGKMHACGHDAHTASLLGTAEILQQLRGELRGRIQLIFQPSEEKSPGGARVMIEEGVLSGPGTQAILGQHVMPLLPAGTVGIRPGLYMASTDELYITLYGKGGHGAQPHTTVDPVAIMAQVITALQQVISRKNDPRRPSVLTIGRVIAEGATNVIPEKVELQGTFRAFDETWRAAAHGHIRQIITGITESLGGRAEVTIVEGYPVLVNDEALTSRVKNHLQAYVGPENVVDLDLWTAAEDFAFYTHQIPGCFYRLGTRNEARGIVHGLHTPQFDIDEEALRLSTGLMAYLAIETLRELAG